MVVAVVLSPTDAASQEDVVGSAQHVVMARARALRDAAEQHCLEYLSAPSIRVLSSREALGRSYSPRVYSQKLHHALRMRRSTSMDKSIVVGVLIYHVVKHESLKCIVHINRLYLNHIQ